MLSRRNGDYTRSVFSALAAIVALAVPTIALAETPAGAPSSNEEAAKAPPKHPAKHAKKTHAKADARPKQEAHAKVDAHTKETKPEEASAKGKAQQGATTAAPKGKKTKKTASRAAAGRKKAGAKKSDSDAPQKPCLGAHVTVDRGGTEGQSLMLVDCHGAPLDAAREELSVLARPWSTPRPHAKAPEPKKKHGHAKAKDKPGAPGEIAPGVRLVDPGLLARLDAIGRHFPGRPISLVSGYRPQSKGSQHQTARALDLRVAGVSNEELVEFCKTLTDTACGYYPNSSFVHVDVRNPGTGVVSWIDASGPHEAPRYVRQWPLPAGDGDAKSDATADAEPHDAMANPWELDRDPDGAGDTAKDKPASPADNSAPPAKPTMRPPVE